jgi:CRP-like cAMP-binding protein
MIAAKLAPRIVCGLDTICQKNTEAMEIFFIMEGKVDQLTQEDRKVADTLTKYEYFGEEALGTGTLYNSTFVAKTFCLLYVLHFNDFEEILSDNYLKEMINFESIE